MGRIAIVFLMVVVVAVGADDSSNNVQESSNYFVSSSTVKYSCPVGQLFKIYRKEVDRVTITCGNPGPDEGEVSSCFQQSGSLCTGEGQFLAQIVEMPDHSGMMSTCCTFKVAGRQKRSTESCSTYKVTPVELAQPNHPKKPKGGDVPVVIPEGHEVQTKLYETKDYGSKPPNGNNAAVKGLVPTPLGWSVIVCQNGENKQQPSPSPSPSSNNNGRQVGTCSSQAECASKCAAASGSAGGPGVAPTKKKRDAPSNVLSSTCSSGSCVCQFQKVPDSLKNLPVAQGAGGSGLCFSADSTVATPTGPMRMDALKVGHQVLVMNEATGQTTFERVDSFIHRRPDVAAEFHQLKTRNGNVLTLSPGHLVPVVDCANPSAPTTLKYAQDTSVGECLLVHNDGHISTSQIQSIESVSKTGIFAPLTQSGNLVVDDVIASCYSAYEGHFVQNSFYRMYMMLTNWLAGHSAENLNPMDAPPVLHLFETINSV